MSRTGARQVFFVCAAIIENQLVSHIVPANSPDEASKVFADLFSHPPKDIMGPFFKKRGDVIEKTRNLKIGNQCRKAVYNDWLVNAFSLREPENYAYLIFIKRMDDRKIPFPKGIITVPISELRFV